MAHMADSGIETRPVFYCAHEMPMYDAGGERFPVAQELSARGISLPSFPTLSHADAERVCQALASALAEPASTYKSGRP